MTDIRAEIAAAWPFETLPPPSETDSGATTPADDILNGTATYLDALYTAGEQIQAQQRIDTATGAELETLAAEVGVIKQTGESDQHLRERAQIAKAAARTDGTIGGLAQLLTALFGDAATEMDVEPAVGEPVILLSIPDTIFTEITLTPMELETALKDAIPAGDGLSIVTSETFRFGASGDQGLGNGVLV